MKRWFTIAAVVVCVVALALAYRYFDRVARQIEHQSTIDEVRPADVIVVLGAAEYRGRPSPVLEARLNHALWLYLQDKAPLSADHRRRRRRSAVH